MGLVASMRLMAQSLSQTIMFLCIMALANLLKRKRVFSEDDAKVLGKIALNITLPAAIIASFDTFKMDYSLFFLILIGIVTNLILMALSFATMRKQSDSMKAFALLNGATYNIGNFSFPMVQTLFGAPGLVAAALFDLGNALMTTGFTYSVASSVAGGKRPGAKDIVAKLFSSIPFLAYLVMIMLTFLNLSLPRFLVEWMQAVGKANPVIAMLMIGFMLDIHYEKHWIRNIGLLMLIRYGCAILFTYLVFRYTQFNHMIKVTLALMVFSPISTVAPAYTQKISDKAKLSSFALSLSTLVSIFSCLILLPLLD